MSLASKDSKHREGGRIQTLTFGRDDVVLRVYDKVAEIEQQSHKTWLFASVGRRLRRRVADRMASAQGATAAVWHSHPGKPVRAPRRCAALPGRANTPPCGCPLPTATARGGHCTRCGKTFSSGLREFDSLGAQRTDSADAALDERLMRCVLSVYGYLKRIAAIQALQQGRQDVSRCRSYCRELRDAAAAGP